MNKLDEGLLQCPLCGGRLDEAEEDTENMTDGQEADYFAGFNHPHICTVCGSMFLLDTLRGG